MEDRLQRGDRQRLPETAGSGEEAHVAFLADKGMQVRGLVHVQVSFLTVSKELFDVVIFCPVVCAYHSHAQLTKERQFVAWMYPLGDNPLSTCS